MVDAVVVDRDGRPVMDLQRDDFVLREEGREQPITHFERLRLEEIAAGVARRPPVSANTGTAAGPPTALLAIVFDEQHLRPETLPDARKAVLGLLDNGLAVGDELLLVATGGREYWRARDQVGLQAVRAHVPDLRALHVRSPDEDFVTEYEAMQIDVLHAGTVEHVFEVPSPRALYVSAVLSDFVRAQGSPAPAFIARRTFTMGGRLLYQFEVHNASAAAGVRRVLAGHAVRTAEGVVLAREEETPLTEGPDGKLARLIPISLVRTQPGRYEISLHVRDEIGGASLQVVEPFEVVAASR
jgi:hypothetical protein